MSTISSASGSRLHTFGRTLAVAAGCALLFPASGAADLIRLKNGGEIRGTADKSTTGRSEKLTITTLTGATITVEQSEVEFFTRRSAAVEEYETKVRRLEDTEQAHWELAEWCREQRLVSQRKEHLARVVELNPDHERARRALGHVRHNGEWMDRHQHMLSRGYVKHGSRYVTPQERELLEKTAAELEQEREWYPKVRLWSGWLTGRNADRRNTGLQNLREITDPNAVPAIEQFLIDDQNKAMRTLAVGILSQIPDQKPVLPLVNLVLEDANYELRYAALNAIRPSQYEFAIPYLIEALRSDLNKTVCRAASALGRVGNDQAIDPLIEALRTEHLYRVRVPIGNSGTMSFRTDGNFAPQGVPLPPQIEGMLRTGQLPHGVAVRSDNLPGANLRTKVVTVKYEHKNEEVLAALKKLTGQNFGYDERSWKLWWAADKSGILE